jgi:hypothetical protein
MGGFTQATGLDVRWKAGAMVAVEDEESVKPVTQADFDRLSRARRRARRVRLRKLQASW